ncbi:MAG: ATP-binding protein, partial [Proteobacteria bacterium]|nr:ATP-binding protein [Pseudomonadota bacterium]
IRNALHYSAPNPNINIYLSETKPHDLVIIEIEDNGPGVPEEQLETIFNPFYRVDSSREKKTGGYGLGLAIAKQAINLHQGQIEAYNRKNQSGLVIRISLHRKT